jgi:hypothetical protein
LARRAGGYERLVAEVRAILGAEAFTMAWAEGQAMTLEQAIAYAFDTDTNATEPPQLNQAAV